MLLGNIASHLLPISATTPQSSADPSLWVNVVTIATSIVSGVAAGIIAAVVAVRTDRRAQARSEETRWEGALPEARRAYVKDVLELLEIYRLPVPTFPFNATNIESAAGLDIIQLDEHDPATWSELALRSDEELEEQYRVMSPHFPEVFGPADRETNLQTLRWLRQLQARATVVLDAPIPSFLPGVELRSIDPGPARVIARWLRGEAAWFQEQWARIDATPAVWAGLNFSTVGLFFPVADDAHENRISARMEEIETALALWARGHKYYNYTWFMKRDPRYADDAPLPTLPAEKSSPNGRAN